jgi:hypothetical protein
MLTANSLQLVAVFRGAKLVIFSRIARRFGQYYQLLNRAAEKVWGLGFRVLQQQTPNIK